MTKGLDKKLRTIKDFLDKNNHGIAIIGDLSKSKSNYLKQIVCKNQQYCVQEIMTLDGGLSIYVLHITQNNNV